MTHPSLIGLCGLSRSGKDSVARILIDSYRFERVAFADPLRDLLYGTDPYAATSWEPLLRVQDIVDERGWEYAKAFFPEVRVLLQNLGTTARHVLNEDVWIDAAFRKIKEATHRPAVITDCRYPNEALRISDEGGVLVYVHRPGLARVNAHPSEDMAAEMADEYKAMRGPGTWEPQYHRAINNAGTLEDLTPMVHALAAELGLSGAGIAPLP